MSAYLLGIDNGLTVSKVALFDLEGREIGVASRRVEAQHPYPSWAERDMAAQWQTTAEAIRDVIVGAGVRPESIVGVGNTGFGNGLFLLDRRGAPLRVGVMSLDTRAEALVTNWKMRGIHHHVWTRTLQALWPGQPSALLRWLKQYEPDTYRHIGTVLLCKDYIKYCLTGTITSDFSDMGNTSLLDVRNRRYDRELLELFEIREVASALPPLVQSVAVVGRVTPEAARVTGLAVGTPVVGGLSDVSASALGAGVAGPGQLCIVAGTWDINEVVTVEPLVDPGLFLTTLFPDPRMSLTIEASATSAINLEWFVTQCCAEEQAEARRRGISVYEVCNEAVASLPPGGSSILFHPFLFGSNVQANARAGFYGIAGWHTRAHLLRAIYEGVVYSHLSHIEKLQTAGAQIDAARLVGGASRSRVWTQIFADTLQLVVEVPAGTESGGLWRGDVRWRRHWLLP